jgi:hypothetical protein
LSPDAILVLVDSRGSRPWTEQGNTGRVLIDDAVDLNESCMQTVTSGARNSTDKRSLDDGVRPTDVRPRRGKIEAVTPFWPSDQANCALAMPISLRGGTTRTQVDCLARGQSPADATVERGSLREPASS